MNQWQLSYEGFDPEHEGVRESLCTLANGYFGTRGALPEAVADGVHYPGTYVAGLYDRLVTRIGDHDIENESAPNVANWLPLTFRVDDGPWFRMDEVEVLEHHQTLELRRGVLVRRTRIRDGRGRETSLSQRRIVHLAFEHLAALETVIRAENWSGTLTVRSALDGSVTNSGVARYRDLAGRHFAVAEAAALDGETLVLRARTVQSGVEVVEAARTQVWVDGEPRRPRWQASGTAETAALELTVELSEGQTCGVEKAVALYTSRDMAISEPRSAALEAARDAAPFEALLERHVLEWDALWRRFDINLNGDSRTAQVLNLHVFHLIQVASPKTIDLDVGMPARGLHGEAYRGHIFWDELFMFAPHNYRLPDVARSMLRYRYRRLPAARRAASEAGFSGAMFPWQSASSGREEAQRLHLNPVSGRWLPDETHRQRHINAAIAFNIWQYFQVSGDVDFMAEAGAELFVEIARFWSSVATYDPVDDRYDIVGVVGPDEFHVRDPNWDGTGLRNNAYTNVMAAWVLSTALRVLDPLPELQREAVVDRLSIRREELERWDDVSRKLRVPFHGDGIISQFEGYEQLEELDWDGLRARYDDIHRLDRLLEAEGDDVNRYKASKQADVLMLFYLFSFEELVALFGRLGYEFDETILHRNVDYYLERSSHGSTLSKVVHSWVLARSDRRRSLELFCDALESDISDVQGGTTAEGIHLGAMAATVDLAERGYSGMEVPDGCLRFKPSAPDGLKEVEFRIYYQHRWLTVCIHGDALQITSAPTDLPPVEIAFHDEVAMLEPGATLRFERERH